MTYNFGGSFTERNETGPQPWASVCDSGDGQKLLALTTTGSVLKSTDFGVTWTAAPSITSDAMSGVVFDDLASNLDLSVVYATSRIGVVWKSINDGLTWSNSSSPDGGSSKDWSSIAVSEDGQVVIGT